VNARPQQRLRRRPEGTHGVSADWPTDRRSQIIFDVTALLALTVMVLVLGCKDIRVGGFGWSDSPLHAMDGAMLYDLARSGGAKGGLVQWATTYYARYPCLGLVVYYPPFHPLIEAGAYALFGVSEAVARETVVAMAVVAVVGLYWLGVQLFGRWGAVLAAGLLLTAPSGLQWLRGVMLEWPAAAMAILAVGCYRAWYRQPSWGWAIVGALATCAAVLTKQTTLFLLGVFPVHLLTVGVVAAFRGNWPPDRRANRRQSDVRLALTVALAALIILVVLAGYDWFSSKYADFSRFLVSGRPPWAHLAELGTYTQYFRWFGEIFGWPFLVAWLVGLAVIAIRWQWQGCHLPLLWLLMLWLQQTLVAWKEPRYFFFAIPAAALLAARGWTIWPRWRNLPIGLVPLTGLIGYQFVAGALTPTNRLPDYAEAVRLLVSRGDADLVLVDGVRDGQFVFDVRSNPQAAGRIITLRASKLLYSRAARGRWRHTTHRGTPKEIMELLNHCGVRYVVVESQLPAVAESARLDWEEPASKVLRQLLADTERFERIGCFPLACDDPAWAGVELHVYRYRQAPPRKAQTVKIPIPALDKEIEVPLPPAPAMAPS
jgi:hypothetical protein